MARRNAPANLAGRDVTTSPRFRSDELCESIWSHPRWPRGTRPSEPRATEPKGHTLRRGQTCCGLEGRAPRVPILRSAWSLSRRPRGTRPPNPRSRTEGSCTPTWRAHQGVLIDAKRTTACRKRDKDRNNLRESRFSLISRAHRLPRSSPPSSTGTQASSSPVGRHVVFRRPSIQLPGHAGHGYGRLPRARRRRR